MTIAVLFWAAISTRHAMTMKCWSGISVSIQTRGFSPCRKEAEKEVYRQKPLISAAGSRNCGGDIIDAIRQLLHAHCVKEIRLPKEDYDPVWVIWFGKNGEPYECRVTGLRVTADSLTVLAEEKESGDGVQCHSPFELGAKNIDWLHEMYEAVWHQLRETNNVESQIEEP